MKNKIITFLIMLIIIVTVVVCTSLPASADDTVYSGTCGDDLTWYLYSWTGTLRISGSGEMTNYDSETKAPWYSYRHMIKSVDMRGGTSVGDYAFYHCNSITSVDLPDGITSIGDYAFYYCSSLTEITIPNGVTNIYSRAFYNCTALTSITIPDSVTGIGEYAFESCKNLTNITIPNGITSIEKGVFMYCSALVDITIPESVTYIGINAFASCTSLESITILEGVTTIDDAAFSSCSNLTSITIPSSLTSIGENAFKYCSNIDVYTSNLDAWFNISFANLYSLPNFSGTLHVLDENGNELNELIVPDSISTMSAGVLAGSTALTITIPDNITNIGDYAFYKCKNLNEITIPNGVTSIGEYAFLGCTALTSVTFPDNTIEIGTKAFSDCNNLNSVYITNIEKWCNTSFKTYYSNPLVFADNLYLNGALITELIIPDGVTAIPDYAFSCNCLTGEIIIPDSVTSIGSFAFSGCSSVTGITIPDSVTNIEEYAFENCTALTSINIPNSVTRIGSYALSGCSSLESISLPFVGEKPNPSGNKYPFGYIFGYRDYDGAYSVVQTYSKGSIYLDHVTYYIPSSLKNVTITGDNILEYAFNNCTGLENVVVGSNVKTIGRSAFSGCTGLASVIIPYGVENIGSSTFYDCVNLTNITIPDSVTSIGNYVFYNCNALTSVSLPDGITTIGSYMFSGCTALTSILIPNSVTSIGSCAFQGCDNITSITLPESLTTIEGSAFSECYRLVEVINKSSLEISKGSYSHGYVGYYAIEVHNSESKLINQDGYIFYQSNEYVLVNYIGEDTNLILPSHCNGNISYSVGTYAFYYKDNIESVKITANLKDIGSYSFRGCSGLKIIYIDSSAIARGLLTEMSHGDLIYNAEVVLVEKSITELGYFVRTAFQNTEELNYEGTDYISYSLHSHIWQDCSYESIQCVQDGFDGFACTICGLLKGSTLSAHKYDSYAETDRDYHWDVCADCGIVGNITHHIYGEWTDAIEAGCLTNGTLGHYRCECNLNFNENHDILDDLTILATGHIEADAVEENRISPTCTTKGSYDSVVYCSGCNIELTRVTLTLESLVHEYSYEWTTDVAPTCTTAGSKSHHCANCDDIKDVTVIPELGHDITTHNAVSPTCTEVGNEIYEACTRCSYTTYVEISALGHTESDVSEENRIKPTCTENGSYDTVIYCSVCNIELNRVTETINKLGHDEVEHKAITPTCTAVGCDAYVTCTRCDFTTYNELEALGHTNADAIEENRQDPTCIEGGSYDSVIYCSVCNTELNRVNEIVSALGHSYSTEWTLDINPTCTTEGSKSYHCIRCDDKSNITVIPSLGHMRENAVEENCVNPTCTKAGKYDSVVYCSVCEEELERISKNLAALGHNYSPTWTTDINPTCTEEGSKCRYCTRCDEKSNVTVIPALGHTNADTVEENRINATCTEDGSYDAVVYCSACNKELSRVTEIIDKLGHDKVSHEAILPTCTETGCDAYVTCTRCDYTTYNEFEALGHTNADAVERNHQDPTCTQNGSYDTVVYCSVCNIVLSSITETIHAPGHEYSDEWTIDVEPTCITVGSKSLHCTRCGDKTETVEIDSLGHTYDDNNDDNCNICSYQREIDSGLSGGAIAGIAAGSTIVVGTGGFSLFWFVIKKRKFADLIAVLKKSV